MPHTDTTPVSASVASTGKGIRYIGQHCYAISGSILNSNTGGPNNTTLKFTSDSHYVLAELNWVSNSGDTGQDEYIRIKMNGETVWDGRYNFAEVATNEQPLKFLIPPLTEVEVLWGMQSDAKDVTVILTGRVYGAV